MNELWRRLAYLFRRSLRDRELAEEMRAHLEMKIAAEMEAGASPEEARSRSRRGFGNPTLLKERSLDMWGWNWLETLLQDARYGLRMLLRSPGFTLTALLTLALGIGANAGIFSVINAALLRPLPYPDPDQLVLLFERTRTGGANVVAFVNFLDWQAQSRAFAAMAAVRGNSFNLGGEGAFLPERIDGAICSWSLFPALAIQPLLGRTFSSAEDQPGAQRVAVISYGLWQRRFGGAPDVLQRQIRLDGENYDIIGVMPRGFGYPHRGVDVWVPVQRVLNAEGRSNRSFHQFYVLARLRAGVSREQAFSELDGIASRIRAAYPREIIGPGVSVFPLAEAGTYRSRTPLLVLFAAVGCLLLVACVNIANLLLARGSERQREVAVRVALGAGRGRILRQLLTESTLLSLLGAVLGLVLGQSLTTLLAVRAPMLLSQGDIDTSAEVRLDAWVFLFTAGVAVLTGLASGLAPAWQIARPDLTGSLREGGRLAGDVRITAIRPRPQLHILRDRRPGQPA